MNCEVVYKTIVYFVSVKVEYAMLLFLKNNIQGIQN